MKGFTAIEAIIVVAILGIIAAVVVPGIMNGNAVTSSTWRNPVMVVETFTSSERINKSDGTWAYRHVGKNEVFENIDSMYHSKYDSADVHRKISNSHGERVCLRVVGERSPRWSRFRNILSVEPMGACEG